MLLNILILLFQAVRCFEDNDIVHVNGKIDPKTGIDLINLELYFSDLDQVTSLKPFLYSYACFAPFGMQGYNPLLLSCYFLFNWTFSFYTMLTQSLDIRNIR